MGGDRRGAWYLALLVLPLALPACQSETPAAASSLTVACSAAPPSGPAPLDVSFQVNVAGAAGAINVQINYGDGTTGTDVARSHTYATAGTYTATFSVSTASQSALCTTTIRAEPHVYVDPTPPPPTGGANRPPDVVFHADPDPEPGFLFRSTQPRFTIGFNVCQSSDPEGDDILYQMDLDGDGDFEVNGATGADCRRSHTYTRRGTTRPQVCVTDLAPSLQPRHNFQCRTYTVVLRP
jgi:hypothetical protein